MTDGGLLAVILTGLLPVSGGLGVVPNIRDFYNKIYGFYSGVCYLKRHLK